MHGKWITTQIHAVVFLELVSEIINQSAIKIFPTEKGVTIGCQNLELVLTVDICDLDDGYIKCPAAQIVHRNLTISLLLFHSISQCSGGRLVDDSLDFKASNFAGIFRRLTL